MQVLRDEMVELFQGMGYKNAKKWNKGRMDRHITELISMAQESNINVEIGTENEQELNVLLLKVVESNEEIEVVMEMKACQEEETEPQEEVETEEDDEEVETGSQEEEEVTNKSSKKGKKNKESGGDKKEKKVGVIASIIEFYKEASEKEPITAGQVLDKLAKRFPERDPNSMKKTINVQTVGRLKSERDLELHKVDGKLWID